MPDSPDQSAPHGSAVQVVTVGHAIVDELARTTDEVVAELGLDKGTMTLVDDERSAAIHDRVAPETSVSGGSAANTAVGLRSLGATTAFVGRVRDDELGDHFAHDIRRAGVGFDVPVATEGPATGRCVVMVTPDAEKTMCTSLGAGDLLGRADVDPALVAAAEIVYLEGYLCGLEHTDPAVAATLDAAAGAGTTVALSLSDPLWVRLHGADMDRLLDRVGIVFANEQEACLMTGRESVEDAVGDLARRCATVVVTLGARGSLVESGGRRARVDADPVETVVDSTGAGDLYAAGYLAGHLAGADLATCARLGSLAAAEVVGHLGARPLVPLQDLARRAGLL